MSSVTVATTAAATATVAGTQSVALAGWYVGFRRRVLRFHRSRRTMSHVWRQNVRLSVRFADVRVV